MTPSTALPKRIFLLSQATDPADVRKILVNTALTDGWMPLVVNMNMSIFVGMIVLTAGFGALDSLVFLGVHLGLTTVAMVIFLLLQVRRQAGNDMTLGLTERLLIGNDVLLMLGWSLGISVFARPDDETRSLLLVLLLAVAGIASAALNAKTLPNLLIGRLALFGPALMMLAVLQPTLWPLLFAAMSVALAFSIGIGYAVHVQLLNEANLTLGLREASRTLGERSADLQAAAEVEKQSQDQLLREAHFRERFLHSINHDLAQPLAGLHMSLFALDKQPLDDNARTAVKTAQACLTTAKSLISDVSDQAQLQGTAPQPLMENVDLGPLLADVAAALRPVAQQKGLDLRTVPSRVSVHADPHMLGRVLRNLVHNALRYTDQGRVVLGVRPGPDTVRIVVADSGRGIAAKAQPFVFDPFFQQAGKDNGRDGHIGLGLAIVQQLTEAMGGTVSLRSTEGVGTAFTVTLNRVGHRARPQMRRALLAEDRPQMRHDMAQLLRDAGFAVTAPGKSDLPDLVGADLTVYDLVLLDFELDQGLTALDILQPCDPAVLARTIVVSDHSDPHFSTQLDDRGIRFVAKPLRAEHIADFVASI